MDWGKHYKLFLFRNKIIRLFRHPFILIADKVEMCFYRIRVFICIFTKKPF